MGLRRNFAKTQYLGHTIRAALKMQVGKEAKIVKKSIQNGPTISQTLQGKCRTKSNDRRKLTANIQVSWS